VAKETKVCAILAPFWKAKWKGGELVVEKNKNSAHTDPISTALFPLVLRFPADKMRSFSSYHDARPHPPTRCAHFHHITMQDHSAVDEI
jgi:hypothetical protein